MIIGVTGPSGAGKSVVCRLVEKKFGFFVIDCDEYAKAAVCERMLEQLTARFGYGILNKDKTLNRRALAAVAFATPENTMVLNQITHPFITALVERDIKQHKNVILDAPTLFESGLDKRCDHIVAVLAQKHVRTNRILDRDGLTEQQLNDRHKAAKPDEFYKSKTDKIIINNGNLQDLNNAATKLFGSIIGGN